MRRNKEAYGKRTGEESVRVCVCAYVRAGVWMGECESSRMCILVRGGAKTKCFVSIGAENVMNAVG